MSAETCDVHDDEDATNGCESCYRERLLETHHNCRGFSTPTAKINFSHVVWSGQTVDDQLVRFRAPEEVRLAGDQWWIVDQWMGTCVILIVHCPWCGVKLEPPKLKSPRDRERDRRAALLRDLHELYIECDWDCPTEKHREMRDKLAARIRKELGR